MAQPEQVDYQADAYWRNKRLTPTQLMVHDIRIEKKKGANSELGSILELNEILPSSFAPDESIRDRLRNSLQVEELSNNRTDQIKLSSLLDGYSWINCLRSKGVQQSVDDELGYRKCRWIHISSKFPEYLQGVLLGLSDWENDPHAIVSAYRHLKHCAYQNERFSKHGKYFSPFFQPLSSFVAQHGSEGHSNAPMILSVPFLDWTVDGRPPPLRFQVDPREGYQSSRSSAHPIRSILQYFYRLEETDDREKVQVFSKYKPWTSNRELDLKIRRWFGHYPTALNVDELWILVVDSRHIVSFASNQSWKSRWPPLQLSSRIAEVSFRSIRNSFLASDEEFDYTSHTHLVACLSGAVGLLHRSFWSDITLCLTDRYAGYLGHLQYRLHRSPSTKLVMDLLQVQEELNIIIDIIQQQIDLICYVKSALSPNDAPEIKPAANKRVSSWSSHLRDNSLQDSMQSTFRQFSTSTLVDPTARLLESLQTEFVDLCDLRDNSNTLVNRTVQLVNIRLEDHGKAILVFTVVTIVFLPLSFVTSFFGMNVSDIRGMDSSQGLFWIVGGSLTAGTVALAVFLAFFGGRILEAILNRKQHRHERDQANSQAQALRSEKGALRHLFSPGFRRRPTEQKRDPEFRVLNVSQFGKSYGM